MDELEINIINDNLKNANAFIKKGQRIAEYWRVVPYDTDVPLPQKFTSWEEADNFIFSTNPSLHAYITIK